MGIFKTLSRVGFILTLFIPLMNFANTTMGQEQETCTWLYDYKAFVRLQINGISEDLLFNQIGIKQENRSSEDTETLNLKIAQLRMLLSELRQEFNDIQWEIHERCPGNLSSIQSQSPSQASSM